MSNIRLCYGFIFALALVSCAPTVQLTTPEPVKIDVGMRVDVYTHEVKREEDAEQGKSPRVARRDRMAEIQALKNDRIVGEGNDGLLILRTVPQDPVYAEYAKKLVAEENADRVSIFKSDATAQNKPYQVIVADFVRRARDGSWPGEWIQADDGSWIKR